MVGSPPPLERRITLDNWDWPPFNRWSFQNVRQILPTRAVPRGAGPARVFPRADQDLTGLRFTDSHGQARLLGEALAATYTDGFLVLHDGRVVGEIYLNGMNPSSEHLSQSVSKSITSALMGSVFERAGLDLMAPVTRYVPELARCGYDGALLWHVLDMRSGVKFVEDYLDRQSAVGMFERVSLWKPQRPGEPLSSYDFILTLPQAGPHGGMFDYRSIETEILGWVLERTTGLGLAELLAREIWQPMGAEFDACFTVDRAGSCMASGGFNATLRDYGRFAQMMLDEGTVDGRPIVPAGWVRACSKGDHSVFGEDYSEPFARFPQAAYSRQWWALDPTSGFMAALGIFGQMIVIDPAQRMAVVVLSSWPEPLNQERRIVILEAISAIGRELTGR